MTEAGSQPTIEVSASWSQTKPKRQASPSIGGIKSGDHGRTVKVYHWIHTGNDRSNRQPPHRIPLAKQADVSGMLEDIKSK
jgi:hypothetical protein